MKGVCVQVQSIFCFHGLETNLALIYEGVWEVDSLHMIHDVVLLCICFSTQSTLKPWNTSRHFLLDILQ